MTDKWEIRQGADKSTCWIQEKKKDGWVKHIANNIQYEDGKQIVHEHNTYGLFVEALEHILSIKADHSDKFYEIKIIANNALKQANNKE